MKNLIMIFITLFSLNLLAQEVVTTTADATLSAESLKPIFMPETFAIKSGDTKIIPLPHYTYIDRISLEVKNSLLCSEDSVHMSFDGFSSRNVRVEGGFKGYRTKIIVADVRARNIEIYNSSNCKVKIKSIQVLPRRLNAGTCCGHGPIFTTGTEAAAQVSFLMESFLYLDSLVADADRVTYLTPAKKILGSALAILNTSPETSQSALAAIKNVIEYLNSAKPFLDRLSSIETTFEISTEIQSAQSSLERMVR